MLNEHAKSLGWELCKSGERGNTNIFEYAAHMVFVPFSDEVMKLPRNHRGFFDKGYIKLVCIRRKKVVENET